MEGEARLLESGDARRQVEEAPQSAARGVAVRFLVTYALLLAIATALIGIWIGQQIEDGVLSRTAAVTASYIDSFVAPQAQSLATNPSLSPSERKALGDILAKTELGQRIVGFRIWGRDGTVLYSPLPALQGQHFEVVGDRARAFQGEVTVDMSDLSDPENVFERQKYTRLVEMYVPIREDSSGRILGVAEFYQLPNEIDADVANARNRTWLLLLLAAAASYLLVAGMVLRAARTISRQQDRLRSQVRELFTLFSQVGDLNVRLRQAGAHAEAIAAQEGRRISADLHDGPGQALALALLQFEDLEASSGAQGSPKLTAAREAISDALEELRQIAAGLRLPELEPMGLADVIARAVRDHERRSGTAVHLRAESLPASAPLAVKIGAFRALQETLSNATRHGRGIDVVVSAWEDEGHLWLEVSDGGPGFDPHARRSTTRLGLAGLRERTALLGGSFEVRSATGRGARVRMSWPLADAAGEGENAGDDRVDTSMDVRPSGVEAVATPRTGSRPERAQGAPDPAAGGARA